MLGGDVSVSFRLSHLVAFFAFVLRLQFGFSVHPLAFHFTPFSVHIRTILTSRSTAPTLADQPQLPRTQAFVLESFRWRPVSAGGFAHKATRDIVWKNYLIPKGTTVIGNVWYVFTPTFLSSLRSPLSSFGQGKLTTGYRSVGRDPQFFPDPETFNPSRWLNDDGTIKEDLKAYTFGFGRRCVQRHSLLLSQTDVFRSVCPGQHMASASVFLNTALLQWAFTMSKYPKGEKGAEIDEWAFTESANTHPMPFRVRFEARAAKTREGVRELMEEYGE